MNHLSVRSDLVEAHERAWAAIAAPGTWLTGKRRVAVAAEIRRARACLQCARIKAALSPNIPGEHETTGDLAAAEVELIHRVVCDPGRLSEKSYPSPEKVRLLPLSPNDPLAEPILFQPPHRFWT